MVASALITLRETVEASLVVGIVLALLRRTGNERHESVLWLGVVAGLVASLALAFVLDRVFGGLTGRAEELYEAALMFVAAGLVIWMVVWMLRRRAAIRSDIEGTVTRHIEDDHPLGIFFLVAISTAREAAETVIFLQALFLRSGIGHHVLGGMLGILAAIALSYALFRGIGRVPLRQFFSVTSVLMLVLAGNLLLNAVHELREAMA